MFLFSVGVERLLQVAECSHHAEKATSTVTSSGGRLLPVGSSTRMHVSVALAKLYENCGYDRLPSVLYWEYVLLVDYSRAQRKTFKEICAAFVR